MGEMKPGLHAAKLAVMEKVRRVEKTRRMVSGSGGYQYAGVEEIIAEVRPAMVLNGLTISPEKIEHLSSEKYQTQKGGNMTRTLVKVTYRLVHSSGECEEIQALGEAADAGDKSANKCMTAALKYALLQTFLLQGGHDDPDDYASQEQVPAQRQPRPARLEAATPPAVTPAASSKLADKILSAIDSAKTLAELTVVKGKANDKRKFLLPDDAKVVRERLQAREQEFLTGSKRGTKQREPGEDG